MPIRTGRLALFACALALATACQKAPEGPQTDAVSTQSSADVPLAVTEVVVVPDDRSDTNRPIRPGDGIEIALRTEGGSGVEILVKVIALADGATVASETVLVDADRLSVRLDGGAHWSEGRHLVEITGDGKLLAHQEFDVHGGTEPPDA